MSKNTKKTPEKKDYRTWLSLEETGDRLEKYTETDPRFSNRSAAARHLIELGFKADKKAREKALASFKI